MYSSTLRVLILDRELDRIREYVSNVPHRATGGLLAGIHFAKSGTDHLLILHVTTEIPDVRQADENCVDHPVLVAEDFSRRPADVPSGLQLMGRWHAHLDGLNRPSSSDLEWAVSLLDDPSTHLEVLLHPIVIPTLYEVRIYPYISTRSGLTFQKLNWQVATQAEIDELRSGRTAHNQPQSSSAGTQLFSLVKTRDKFRKEARAVETMANVVKAEVTDDGAKASLHVEMRRGDDEIHCWVTGDTLYPVHAPVLRVELNGRHLNFKSGTLRDWNSMHQLADLVKDVNLHLSRMEREEALPVPDIHESDPVKREGAMLRAAGYYVSTTEATRAGTLLLVRSPVLDHAGKIFYAILPPSYPNGSPSCALADSDLPLAEVEFETLDEVTDGFTLLTFLEKLYPAARARRAEAELARSRTGSAWTALVYVLLFIVSAAVGFVWEITGEKSPQVLWRQVVAMVRGPLPTLATGATPVPSGQPAAVPAIPLSRQAPVLVICIDGGQVTNMTAEQAQALVSSALGGAPARAVTLDLKNPTQDQEMAKKEAARVQAFVVFTYKASEKQAQVLRLLRASGKPVLVLSVAPGDQEKAVQESSALYQVLNQRDVRGTAQQALADWTTRGALVIR